MEAASPEDEDRLAAALLQRQQHQHSSHYTHHLHRQPNFESSYEYHEPDIDPDSDLDAYRHPSDSSNRQSLQHYLPASPVANGFHFSNLHVSTADQAAGLSTNGHALSGVNPDDFYRPYRGVHSLNHHQRTLSSENDYMATSISRTRDKPAVRPNGSGSATGTAPGTGANSKHPPAPVSASAARTALRPTQRSSSAPVEPAIGATRTNTNRKPSVKDLTKRFDLQTSDAPQIPTTRTRFDKSTFHARKLQSQFSVNLQATAALDAATEALPSIAQFSTSTIGLDCDHRKFAISVGPIDFEQRREHIRLAYTKSIRDSQARDARQAAARRKKDQESATAEAEEAIPPVPSIDKAAKQEAEENGSVPFTKSTEPPIDDSLGSTQAVVEAAAEAPPQVREAASEEPGPSTQGTAPSSPPHPLTISTAVPSVMAIAPPPSLAIDSPTLGIPGSFPALSPPMEKEEIPQSAISTTTETTEFDIEPQTLPPLQLEATRPPTGLGLTIAQADGNHEQAQIEEVRLSPTTEKAEYQYPFEDEPAQEEPSHRETTTSEVALDDKTPDDEATDDQVSIRISLDPTSPQQSPEPTPTRSDFEDTSLPGAFACSRPISKEYEPMPFSSPSIETTVKILRRESEYDSPRQDTVPFPRMDSYEDVDSQSQVDADESVCDVSYFPDRAEKQLAAASGEALDRPEDFYSSRPKDTDSSQRASTCESSDAQEDAHKTSLESQQTPDTSHSLTVPSIHPSANRVSQQSVWTDLSVDSTDPPEHRTSAFQNDMLPLPKAPFASEQLYGTSSSRDSSARHSQHFASDFSPSESGESQPPRRANIHQLPELDTGEGFSVPYLDGIVPLPPPKDKDRRSQAPRPDHEPPPIPRSGSVYEGRRTAASSYYGDTLPGSTLVGSRRQSEDVSRPVSTTHSIDHMSIETRDHSLGGQTPIESTSTPIRDKDGPTGKEKHRLVQRRNVIRELIDTEMVFVRDMNIVEEIYKGTAEACPRLDDKTIKLIFRNTDEIISFHTVFLSQLKDAVASVYVPHGRRSPLPKEDSAAPSHGTSASVKAATPELDDQRDRATGLGPVFKKHIDQMRVAHEGFLRNSDHAAKRLIQIQQDPTVKVWLNECNEVAKDLTAAWDLDSLLIKPMQRITKYPTLIMTLLSHTPQDHPDRAELISAKETLELAIVEINKTKKNFELVGQIVGRKRKESDVKAGFARAFGKRVDKLQATSSRIPEDAVYAKLHEKFGDDYLRLQVVLRDVEFYTRQVSAYVHEFLQYLSSMELVMRLQPGSYPELESKWVQFNVSMRDIEKIALEDHLQQVRKHVIEPFEHVIKAYGNPSLAMKKRAKRRLDYERSEQLKKSGKTVDAKLKELVEQYDALNETLKKELPQLSALTEKVGNICLGNFVNIQANWYSIWVEKVKKVTGETGPPPEVTEIVNTFHRDYKYAQEMFSNIGILNPTYKGRSSQSTTASTDEASSKLRGRPTELSPRGRGLSVNGDHAPMLPTPDFAKRHSGQFTMSPATTPLSPHQFYYRDYYAGANVQRPSVAPSPVAGDQSPITRGNIPSSLTRPVNNQRDPNPGNMVQYHQSGESRRFSGLFHSALPMTDGTEETQISSRASSRERAPVGNGYNVLWLAASLFEFNIETTKHEAGYPYLTYQAGEIFDVIAEKGELWLAKNQDDPDDQVGWIWSKHFAKLADS
ncbi:Dynamin-binding protein [Colletotrichum spinosum]|uniref:Dynamin-binding protein n=1 Tax=Colletotrichum spinosum TaxID=1347390 RepID=A0A4R8Q5N7_9PEZI|nr:Dynamin-binding protein [Colletotrichum spinosum]